MPRKGGIRIADNFVARLNVFCDRLDLAPLRGPVRDDLQTGIRIVTFEKSVSVAYLVSDDRIDVVRFLYRGRDLSEAFGP